MMEQWKPIKGFEGVYEVSSLGRVKSVAGYKPFSDGRKRFFNERIRKPVPADGYYYVVLVKQLAQKRYLIHRLVAEAFLPNPDNKPCVDHINTDTSDNRACNLRWVTHEENQKNSITAKRLSAPSRPVLRIDSEGNTKLYNKVVDVAKDGFNPSRVIAVARKKADYYKGYKWKYLNESINNDNNQKKRVECLLDDGTIVEYNSLIEAAKAVCGNKANVKACCIGKRQRYKGCQWRYKTE